ncbi:E3 ubiquitin-protein ligase RLIM [Heracleum sosnowskyi]|uniref:E3 ubiquitin-protein ligase RLIM n=1 Tax=Heracleum sosnowskyi TaxID=360622 RepID=A0AAD8H149_9APIA|nr:E3 ubiquitin-protein ligase RLIM [Heracleum sosnowskyi]
MTSASELFNNRRYRFGRNPNELGGFDSGDGAGEGHSFHHNRRRNNHHSHGSRRRHHDVEGCDHPRRGDNHVSRRASLERESVRFDQGGGSSSSLSIPANVDLEAFTSIPSRERFVRSDRLPGDVLLARERLLERLRGIQLTGRSDPRGNIRASYLTLHRNMRDVEEWRMLAGLNPSTRSNADMGLILTSDATKYRPPGLAQDDLDHLHIEVFTATEKGDEENTSRASLECSICLETFVEGVELVCLPCGHKYHQCCLYPWVRACGDCPYCRAAIIVTDYKAVE